MAQQQAKTVRVALNKGFVSEATPLTYPENTTKDELNVALDRKGARYKRRAINIEAGGSWVPRPGPFNVSSSFVWEFAAGLKDKSFLVLQEDNNLLLFDLRNRPLSTTGHVASLDLAPHFTVGSTEARLSFATVKGLLVVVGSNLNSVTVQYKPESGAFEVKPVQFRLRDFEWMTDPKSSLTSEGSYPPSIQRRYDSYNTGWTPAYFEDYGSIFNVRRSPPLNKPYWSSKEGNGNINVKYDHWNKTEGGTTLISNGKHILNLYTMDRDAASGLSGVNATALSRGLGPETSRFTTVVGYAGRVFFAGLSSRRSSGRIYFSQVVETVEEIGEFYSVNDPTAEYLSDLLDTDGGYVDIPEAEGILKLHVFGTNLLVFATNGVWSISGVDDVFRATDYTVNSLGRVANTSMSSFVSADGRPYWWSDTGIQTVTITEFKNLEVVSVSDSSIKTFIQDIPVPSRNAVFGAFDELNQQVFWIYRDSEPVDKVVVLDENHGAFLKWAFLPGLRGERVTGLFYNRHQATSVSEDTVVNEVYDTVVSNTDEEIVVDATISASSILPFTFIAKDNTNSVTFAYLTEGLFADWAVSEYDAYLETGYSFLGDISTFKNTPYLTVLSKLTEYGWESPFVPAGQSSLFASVFWDGNYTPAYRPQQVYQIHRYVYPTSPSSPFVTDGDLIQTKIVPRGRGKSMRIRFEAEKGKDFYLFGFETLDAKNSIT